MSDDTDIEILATPSKQKKKGGRKPKSTTNPRVTGSKRKGVVAATTSSTLKQKGGEQKSITEVLKPVGEASPAKKVRKTRSSTFDKKNGAVLERLNKKANDQKEDKMVVEKSSGEVVVKARPQRACRMQISKSVQR